MSRKIAGFVHWACLAFLVFLPLMALYFLFDLAGFATLAHRSLNLPIDWTTVTQAQYLGLWFLLCVNLAVGWVGLYFLRRAFINFAKGEYFNRRNSVDLRRFSLFLLAQPLAQFFFHVIAGIVLSWNHGPGEKILSISVGSDELWLVILAMVFWVISDLLVKAANINQENSQFI